MKPRIQWGRLLRRSLALFLATLAVWALLVCSGGGSAANAFRSLGQDPGFVSAALSAELGQVAEDDGPLSGLSGWARLVVDQSPLLRGNGDAVAGHLDGSAPATPDLPAGQPAQDHDDISEPPPETTAAPEDIIARTLVPTSTQGYEVSGSLYLYNRTGLDVDLAAAAAAPVNIALPAEGPQILIVHTHGSEAYTPDGTDIYEPSDNNTRTLDENYNVVRVGDEMERVFTELGLTVVHDRTLYDYPKYNGAYDRSAEAVQRYLEQYPSIKIVLDVHRDALVGEDGTVYKAVTRIDGVDTAQVMLVLGSSEGGEHPNWMQNLSLACRIHNKSPKKYLKKIVDVVRSGMGFPACHFDDAHIKMMLAKGVSIEDARDYCLMGCVEPQKAGRLYQWTSTAYTQWPICIELVLNHGVPLWYGKQVCPDMGDLNSFKTYEEFEAAVKEEIKYITKWTSVATVISQRVHRELAPKPLMSIMYEGCMEKGKDVSSGGAMYNFGPGVVWSGLATYADSMAAIKKLVFDDKKYTLEQLNEALKADFNGYEQIRTDCLNAPKYGNDDDYADDIAADLINFTEHEHRQYKTLYSILSHGTLSISNNTPFGQMTGASANGRHAWLPLSDGISPSQGADFKGPTAIIKSVSKMSNDNMNIGMVHNFKIMAGLLDTPEGEESLITLLRTACMFGNGEMQFNYLDNKTLIEAQKHPEQYRDLIVRVAGYSAFFVELCKDVQDEIISRTMLTHF